MSPADTADPREADAARVRELYALTDPDAGQGDVIDGLVLAAAEAAGVPMATLNLLDTDRQCQASTAGFTGGVSPRREAMCDVTVQDGTFVYVPNAAEDPRFADSPWVDGRRGDVRFYAGFRWSPAAATSSGRCACSIPSLITSPTPRSAGCSSSPTGSSRRSSRAAPPAQHSGDSPRASAVGKRRRRRLCPTAVRRT